MARLVRSLRPSSCLPAFERHPHPDLVRPDITFDGEALDLTLGGTTLQLRHFGPSHGQGTVVMLLPRERILFVVDLVSPGAAGYRILPDYDPWELVRTLREIEERLDFDRIVPGHMGPVAPASAVAEERRYYEQLIAAVGAAWERGVRDPAELAASIELPEYADWYGYEEWLPLTSSASGRTTTWAGDLGDGRKQEPFLRRAGSP